MNYQTQDMIAYLESENIKSIKLKHTPSKVVVKDMSTIIDKIDKIDKVDEIKLIKKKPHKEESSIIKKQTKSLNLDFMNQENITWL